MSATETPQTQDSKPKRKMSKKRKRALTILGAVFLLFGIFYLIYWLIWGRFEEYTDDAYVSGNQVQLMPQISGTVIAINTDDTHLVTIGQKLIELDSADMLIALQRARANLATTVRQVRQYYSDVQQAQANLALRKADLNKAELDLSRRAGLVGERAISREELQHYTTSVKTTQAQYNYALNKLASTLALVENSNLYEHPLVEKAKANFKTAYLKWVRTVIYAPVKGYVAKRSVQVGQQVNPNTALLAIIPLNEVWIDANYKENQLDRIRIGQAADVIADANGVTYHGKVVGLSPGTGSAFALLPPQNATGNWIKIVQRLPVRIVLDPNELAKNPLQIGLSVRVTIYTRWLKGEVLSQVIDKQSIYSTSIYNDQLAHAEQEIDAILRKNAPDMSMSVLMSTSDNSQLHLKTAPSDPIYPALPGILGMTLSKEPIHA